MKLSERLENVKGAFSKRIDVSELVKEAQALEARVSCAESELADEKAKKEGEHPVVRLVLEIPRDTEWNKAVNQINETAQLWITKAPETFRKRV